MMLFDICYSIVQGDSLARGPKLLEKCIQVCLDVFKSI
jgi:hypothetical protein